MPDSAHSNPHEARTSPSLLGIGQKQLLQLYFIYRLALSSTLLLFFLTHSGPSLFGQHNYALFSLVSITYLGFVIASGIALYALPGLPTSNQAFLMVFVDIVAIILLMHASGGVTTGIGMLLAFSIAAGSLIIQGIPATSLAALASLIVLGEQLFSQLTNAFPTTAYTHAGILGGALFAIAALSHVLSIRLHRSEALASQRKLDLANLEQLNEYVIQHMRTGIIVVDGQNKIRLMNEAAWYLLGMPERRENKLLRLTCRRLAEHLEIWRSDMQKNPLDFSPLRGGRELRAGFSKLGRQGAGGVVIFLEDTATLSQQLQQMKLASLGRLTASIAHEIRNPLGAISHAEQLLRESPDFPTDEQRLIDIISTNSKRVNEIIENVLQLSRRQNSQPEEFLLKPWIEKFAEEFSHEHGTLGGRLDVAIDPENTLVHADPTQLRQMLIILCENSIRHFHHDPAELDLRISGGITKESGGPFLDILDNGPGIGEEAAKQVFEPFFTTLNTGTGLGLYIARELGEANRLGLDYIGRKSGGSCFRITFPGRGNKPIDT